jgi:hypothetical protein
MSTGQMVSLLVVVAVQLSSILLAKQLYGHGEEFVACFKITLESQRSAEPLASLAKVHRLNVRALNINGVFPSRHVRSIKMRVPIHSTSISLQSTL